MLENTVKHNTSIEIDLYFNSVKNVYEIGHPASFYEYFDVPRASATVDEAVDMLKHSNALVTIDIKSNLALDKAIAICEELGRHRVLIHFFLKEMHFQPFAADVVVYPHWLEEDLSIADLLYLKNHLHNTVPIQVSCRGLSKIRLDEQCWLDELYKRLEILKGQVDVISLIQPNSLVPSPEFLISIF